MPNMEREKIGVGRLSIGMYVSELDRPWLDSPFLFQGFPIRNEDEIKQLQECCQYVYIDRERSIEWQPDARFSTQSIEEAPAVRFSTQGVNRAKSLEVVKYRDRVSFVDALPEAMALHSDTKSYIDSALEDVRLGHSIDIHGARDLANRLADNIVKNENAMVWLTQLKKRDEYTSMHSINVCVLSLLFGRFLGLEEEKLGLLGLGALLHDVGKMRVPKPILNKPGSLSSEEKVVMNRHPEWGHSILEKQGGVHPAVLDIALSHHERYDGSGYPHGLKGKEISQYAMVVSIIDFYDAVTSDRAYHLGISPHEALNMMYAEAARTFPKPLVESFIQCLGIYPIGSLVELDSGEVGVVMTVNREHRLKPILSLVLDRNKQWLPQSKMMNLELMTRSDTTKRIKSILESNAFGIDVRKLIMQSNMTAPLAMV
ncbi:MAG: HD-GYP domain-containing protein [Chromatiales bacterium]|nr:HD-GYP domain-containing protein [Chromatiales bacterium]